MFFTLPSTRRTCLIPRPLVGHFWLYTLLSMVKTGSRFRIDLKTGPSLNWPLLHSLTPKRLVGVEFHINMFRVEQGKHGFPISLTLLVWRLFRVVERSSDYTCGNLLAQREFQVVELFPVQTTRDSLCLASLHVKLEKSMLTVCFQRYNNQRTKLQIETIFVLCLSFSPSKVEQFLIVTLPAQSSRQIVIHGQPVV